MSHRLKRLVLTSVLIACACTELAIAQERLPLHIGASGGAAVNLHTLKLPVYNGSELCGVYESGTGTRPFFSAILETPWSYGAMGTSPLWLSPRLTYGDLSALITTPAVNQARARDPKDSSLVTTERQHRLQAEIQTLALDLFGRYMITPAFYLVGGPSLGLLTGRSREEKEVIVSPANAVFDGTASSTRVTSTGEIPNVAGLFVAVALGAGLDVPIARKVYLKPEVQFAYGLSSIRSDYDWKISALRGSIGVMFDITREPEPIFVEPVRQDTVRPEKRLEAWVDVVGLMPASSSADSEVRVPQLRVEEFLTREAHPTLNVVFFDRESQVIPARYKRFGSATEATGFSTASFIGKSNLEVYYDILNVLGSRLKTSASRVTLTGMQSAVEKEDVAKARAENVRDYLVNVWSIEPSRITISSKRSPAARNQAPQLEEENQRVEIVTTEAAVLDPLTVDEIERTMNPPVLRVRTNIQSDAGVSSTSLALSQIGRNAQDGSGRPEVLYNFGPAKPQQEWRPSPEQLPSSDEPLIATLTITDKDGRGLVVHDTSLVSQVTIKRKREERLADKIVERYNLITFELDKSELDQRSKRVVDQIAEQLTSGDTIEIAGFTDLVGEADHNRGLATARARNVEQALQAAASKRGRNVTIRAFGEGEREIVDNTLPEGRFLSRTVQIRIDRPVNQL